jgi:hypothetical protein
MKITGVLGLPAGMTSTCLNPTCSFTPSALSCVKLSGTPTTEGVYPLQIAILVYAKVSGVLPTTQKDTIKSFVLNVSGTGSNEIIDTRKLVLKPNPATGQVYVGSAISPVFYNSLGQVQDVLLQPETYGFIVNLKGLKPGLYTVKCGTATKKLVVE